MGIVVVAPTQEEVMKQLEQQVIEHQLSYNAMKGTDGVATIRLKDRRA